METRKFINMDEDFITLWSRVNLLAYRDTINFKTNVMSGRGYPEYNFLKVEGDTEDLEATLSAVSDLAVAGQVDAVQQYFRYCDICAKRTPCDSIGRVFDISGETYKKYKNANPIIDFVNNADFRSDYKLAKACRVYAEYCWAESRGRLQDPEAAQWWGDRAELYFEYFRDLALEEYETDKNILAGAELYYDKEFHNIHMQQYGPNSWNAKGHIEFIAAYDLSDVRLKCQDMEERNKEEIRKINERFEDKCSDEIKLMKSQRSMGEKILQYFKREDMEEAAIRNSFSQELHSEIDKVCLETEREILRLKNKKNDGDIRFPDYDEIVLKLRGLPKSSERDFALGRILLLEGVYENKDEELLEGAGILNNLAGRELSNKYQSLEGTFGEEEQRVI